MKTFLRDLFIKIPKEYFLESETKFYFDSSDRFMMYSIVELAGPKHIKNIPNYLYVYIAPKNSKCQ